jgi:hypothetical protein
MRVDVSAKKLSFPQECACCGASPNSVFVFSAARQKGVRVVRTRTQSWEFPACATCVGHVKAWSAADQSFNSLVVFGSGLALLLMCVNLAAGILVFAVFGGIAFAWRTAGRAGARRRMSGSCVGTTVPGRYLGWDGTLQQFELANPRYATKFMEANASKLVNLEPG